MMLKLVLGNKTIGCLDTVTLSMYWQKNHVVLLDLYDMAQNK